MINFGLYFRVIGKKDQGKKVHGKKEQVKKNTEKKNKGKKEQFLKILNSVPLINIFNTVM